MQHGGPGPASTLLNQLNLPRNQVSASKKQTDWDSHDFFSFECNYSRCSFAHLTLLSTRLGRLEVNLLLWFIFSLLQKKLYFPILFILQTCPSLFESDIFLKASRCYPSVIHNAVEVVCITGLFSFPAPFLIHFGFMYLPLGFTAVFLTLLSFRRHDRRGFTRHILWIMYNQTKDW